MKLTMEMFEEIKKDAEENGSVLTAEEMEEADGVAHDLAIIHNMVMTMYNRLASDMSVPPEPILALIIRHLHTELAGLLESDDVSEETVAICNMILKGELDSDKD